MTWQLTRNRDRGDCTCWHEQHCLNPDSSCLILTTPGLRPPRLPESMLNIARDGNLRRGSGRREGLGVVLYYCLFCCALPYAVQRPPTPFHIPTADITNSTSPAGEYFIFVWNLPQCPYLCLDRSMVVRFHQKVGNLPK